MEEEVARRSGFGECRQEQYDGAGDQKDADNTLFRLAADSRLPLILAVPFFRFFSCHKGRMQ